MNTASRRVLAELDALLGQASGAGVDQATTPDLPDHQLTAVQVTRRVLADRFGQQVLAQDSFVLGLAGLVAARAGLGPSVEAAHAAVRQRIAAGQSPRLLGQWSDDAEDAQLTATSFVATLLETGEPERLGCFFAALARESRDRAALLAFGRPLGVLEEMWLTRLGRPSRPQGVLSAFLGRLFPLLRPYRRQQAYIIALMLCGLTASLVLPLGARYLVDVVIPARDTARLAALVVALLLVYLADSAISVRRATLSAWVSNRLLLDLQEQLFAHLQRLPHRFYSRAKVGDLMARLSVDLQSVQAAMATLTGLGLYLVLRALVAAIALVALDPLLGALVLLVVPLYGVGYVAVRSRMRHASAEARRLGAEGNAIEHEYLSAHAVVKAYGLEDRAIREYRIRLADWERVALRIDHLGAVAEASTSLSAAAGQLLVLGVGGYLVMEGRLSVGTLLAFVGLLAQLFAPITSLSGIGTVVQKAAGALDRMLDVLEEPAEIADRPGAAPLAPLTNEIRFAGITFGYEPDLPVLRELDLTVKRGEHVAIVGPSGAGKSTLASLLMRFWDPQAGSVQFDAQDARDGTLASLRGQVGMVFQDTFVFDTTVRENIAFGRPAATEAQIRGAATAAHLDDYIESLPSGYDTMLGERGVRMSGGQRQRLALARALVRDARILLLDEATSSLDASTERDILDTLVVLARGRTTITITHRLALAAAADRIVVLDGGRIIEQGTHLDLVAAGGLYQRLYEEQMVYVSAARPAASSGGRHGLPRTSRAARRDRRVRAGNTPDLRAQWTGNRVASAPPSWLQE